MILTRRTEPIKAVVSFDDALFDVPQEAMEKYLRTRDMSVLPDLSKLPSVPSVFHVLPLMPRYEYLLAQDSPVFRRELVMYHVIGADNAPDMEFEEGRDGVRKLTQKSADLLPLSVINELANLIAELQTRHAGELDFFTPPDTWRSIRRHAQTLRLLA